MTRNVLRLVAVVVLAYPLARAVGIPSTALADSAINYPDFSNTAGLNLVGAATQIGGALELTSAQQYQTGAVWSTSQVAVNASFESQFSFSLHDGSSPPADGIVFALQTQGPTAIGTNPQEGGDLGFTNIAPSVGVEFDIFQNSYDANANHVGIIVDGSSSTYLASGNPRFPLYTSVDYAWVDYDASSSTLSVYVSPENLKPQSPTVSATVNLPSFLGANTAYAGFTGGTGYYDADQDLLNWFWNPNRTLNVTLTAIPAPVRSGLSYTPGLSSQASFQSSTATYQGEPQCGSGCTYAVVKVTDASGAPVQGASVTIRQTMPDMTSAPGVVSGQLDGNMLCPGFIGTQPTAFSMNGCANSITLTTDGSGSALATYWFPGLNAEVDATLDAVATVDNPRAVGTATTTVPLQPYLVHQATSTVTQGEITGLRVALGLTQSPDPRVQLPAIVAAAVTFDGLFGVAAPGLSLQLSELRNIVLGSEFYSHSFDGAVVSALTSYFGTTLHPGNALKGDQMTARLYEVSFMHQATLTGAGGEYDALYLQFNVSRGGNPVSSSSTLISSDYYPNSWLPAQCQAPYTCNP